MKSRPRRDRSFSTVLLALLVVVGLTPALCWSQEPKKSADDATGDAQEAKRLFEEGIVKYRVGEFEEALARFKAALERANRPSIILNIAQCYRQLEQPKEAIFYFKLYLTEYERQNPGKVSPYKEEIDRHLAALQAELDRREQEEAAERRTEEQLRQAAAEQSATASPKEDAPPPIYKRWWFWTAVGVVVVGGAATATALALQPDAQSAPVGTLEPGSLEL